MMVVQEATLQIGIHKKFLHSSVIIPVFSIQINGGSPHKKKVFFSVLNQSSSVF